MMAHEHTAIAFKAGFIAIAGAPNAGKSTLLNRMLGERISITSRKPQTTRNRILGVVHKPNAQLIFVDTPGVHRTETLFNAKIVEEALLTIGDADIILIVVDASHREEDAENFLVENVSKQRKPVILALNKTDLIKQKEIAPLMDTWMTAYPFASVIPVSAKHGNRVEELMSVMMDFLPESPPLFPEDTLTDVSEKFIAGETIREKVFRLTGQEIPYSTAVTIDTYSEKKKGSGITIHATIHVERDSQKGIIIGKKGSKLKQIGEDARKDIERMTGAKVFLKLFVRVQKNWTGDTKALRKFGYS